MSEKPPYPPIDLYAISFPSDRLTLGQIRKLDQSVNGSGRVFSRSEALDASRACDVYSMIPMFYEMLLAERAYAAKLDLPLPWQLISREEIVQDLMRQWKEDGISSGNQQSKQFIREIEKAAVKQAEAVLGKGH